jgi:hypothetical protein
MGDLAGGRTAMLTASDMVEALSLARWMRSLREEGEAGRWKGRSERRLIALLMGYRAVMTSPRPAAGEP